jgi:hypothetical protein
MKQVLKLTLVVALVLPVLLFAAASAFAGCPDPPGPDKMIIGPTMEGTLMMDTDQMVLENFGYSWAKFIGECREKRVFISTLIWGDFINLTVDGDLINFQITGAAPAGCYSQAGGEDLIITRVKKLTKFPMNASGFQAVIAEIKVKAVVPVPLAP